MPAPLSVTRIYAASLRMWRAHFVTLTILAVLLEAPIVVLELVLHVSGGIEISDRLPLAANLVSAPLAIYGSLSHHFLSGLLEKLVGADRRGHADPTLGEILHELPWVRLLVADIVSTLIVVVGFLALVIPGILLATWLTPLLVVVNLERDTVRRSMLRSYRLVRGHFWRVFLVGLVAVAVVELAGELVGRIVDRFAHSHEAEILSYAVPSALLLPIAALPIVVLTFDLVDLDAVGVPGDGSRPESERG